MTSIVTGTEQRIYGTLSSNCNVWIKRFAICLGSSSLSPSIYTGTIVYGDSVYYKACGYKYNGYLSILFIASGATLPYAVFEVRKCANGKNYIFVDSYGEVASSTLPLSLWFNQGTEIEPDWMFINSCTSGILQRPASEITFKFIENKGSSISTELGCCKKCTGCECLTCVIYNRFSENSIIGNSSNIINYGKLSLGTNTIIFTYINVEYKINCGTIDIWVYKTDSVTTGLNLIIKYYNDSNTWIELYNGLIDDLDLTKFTVSFDYLKNCTTTTVSFSGCPSTVSNSISVPLNAILWNNTTGIQTTVSLTALLTTTSKKQCLDPLTYADFTWDLNYGYLPVMPEIGKNISHIYKAKLINNLGSYVWCDEDNDNLTYPRYYGAYVKTGDVYLNGSIKYLERSNQTCTKFNPITGATARWNADFGGRGVSYNGMACALIGVISSGNKLFSLVISNEMDPNALHIVSYGNDYWIRYGILPVNSETYPSGGQLHINPDGGLLGYTSAYKDQIIYFINESLTTASFGWSSYTPNDIQWGTLYNGYIIGGKASLIGNYPYNGAQLLVYDSNGHLNSTYSNIVRNEAVYGSGSGEKFSFTYNNKLYIFSGSSYVALTSLSDTGPLPVNTPLYTACNSPFSIYPGSACEHNGKLYVYSSGGHLLEFDGVQTFTDTGILLSGNGCLISHNEYLINITSAGGSNIILPYIDIIPNSMLP